MRCKAVGRSWRATGLVLRRAPRYSWVKICTAGALAALGIWRLMLVRVENVRSERQGSVIPGVLLQAFLMRTALSFLLSSVASTDNLRSSEISLGNEAGERGNFNDVPFRGDRNSRAAS